MDKHYDKIIIDFGGSYESMLPELVRCDQKILMIALSEWQLEASLEKLETGGPGSRKDWEYLTVFGSEEIRREIKKKLGLPVRRVPFSLDAFTVTGIDMEFFSKL